MSATVNVPQTVVPAVGSGAAGMLTGAGRLTPFHATRLGGATLAQALGLEAAAILGLVAAAPGPLAAPVGARVAAGIGAAVVAVAALLRRDGRWLTEWAAIWWRWRRRRQAGTPMAAPTGPVGPELTGLLPGLQVREYVDRAARRYGLFHENGEWTAVAAVRRADALVELDPPERSLPLDVLARSLDDRGVRLRTVQLVTVTVPSRSPADFPTGTAPAAARRRSYLAVTLDSAASRAAVRARGGGPDGARRALVGATGRLVARLAEAGVDVDVLGVDDARLALRTCLATVPASAAADPVAGPSLPSQPANQPGGQPEGHPSADRWTGWHLGDVAHVGYRLSRWGPNPPSAVLDAIAGVPALSVVTALALTTTPDGGAGVGLTVRVAQHAADGEATDRAVRGAAAGARLERLDGEHFPALVATLPLGGAW